jgi:gamma-glutamyl:cysteine ligase YbdK (ATP-grasp superfamily)
MTSPDKLRLFEAYGIELEYMIVDQDTLDVLPKSEILLKNPSGDIEAEIEVGDLCWSKELVSHVVELKTNGPVKSLDDAAPRFQDHVERINGMLKPVNGMLLPSAMHPWMDPLRETKIWPYGENTIFQNYDRIFGCRGHGWSNLQSMHLNLPFGDATEFGRLHAAIRLVLPLIPALAASSPFVEDKILGPRDNRLFFYRENQKKVPSIAGRVIPEPVFTPEDYHREILERSWADIAPHDPAKILRYEWLNSRGCIARFDRDAIEIRVIDIQECPAADIAVAALISGAVKRLVEERDVSWPHQKTWAIDPMEPVLWGTAREGEQFVITDPLYLRLFGLKQPSAKAGEVWQHIFERCERDYPMMIRPHRNTLQTIISKGTLATRLMNEVGQNPDRETLRAVYRQLADCLEHGRLFL